MELPGKLSRQQKGRYSKLFALLRKRKKPADDALIADIHDEVFSETDCLTCANCCKTHPPLLIEKDINRIAKHVQLTTAAFVSKFVIIDEDNDWVFHTVPCPFLLPDNACSIYDVRPQACRQYPHTNRKKLYQIANITMKNAEICPAVTRIIDTINQKIKE